MAVMGMFDHFENYIYGSLGLETGSMIKFIKDKTDKLFDLKRTPNFTEIVQVNLKKVVPRRFYLIQYNYNGNLIWCPILALDYKVINNKNILYSLNLEYLPPLFKIKYFDLIFRRLKDELSKIADTDKIVNERPLKPLSFEFIYKTLKQNGNMDYAITAYDMLKIKKAYLISIKIAPEIIMCDPKRYNSKSMKELFEKLPESEEKDVLGNIIEEHDKLIEQYKEDSIQYHKEIANFEKYFKIIK